MTAFLRFSSAPRVLDDLCFFVLHQLVQRPDRPRQAFDILCDLLLGALKAGHLLALLV